MTKEVAIKRIKKFIKDNELMFNSSDSSINSDYVIISGFTDFLNEYLDPTEHIKFSDLLNAIAEVRKKNITNKADFRIVFNYAEHSYGKWWKKKLAKKLYKF